MSNTFKSASGWGAWQNLKKENELLKSQLSESKASIELDENEVIKKLISKNKSQVKELISKAEMKKQELKESIDKLMNEFNNFEKENNEAIEKIVKKITMYKEMIDSIEEDNTPMNKSAGTKEETNINTNKNQLFIGGLKDNVKDSDLYDLFKKYGEIDGCRILTECIDGKLISKCCGFVRFKNETSAASAIEFLKGRYVGLSMYPLRISYSNSKDLKDWNNTLPNDYNIIPIQLAS